MASDPPTQHNPTDLAAGNYRYADRTFLVDSGKKEKFNANLAALRTLRTIKAEGRNTATPEEQAVLAKFTGWGQFPEVFNDYNEIAGTDESKGQHGKNVDRSSWARSQAMWARERETLQGLLSPEEWDSARKSTLNAHYTHPDIVDAHWKAAQKLGFAGGRYLETSAGIGFYLGMMPPELASKTRTSAVELDQGTGNMLGMLYPSAKVHVQGFENHAAPNGFYDLIASNVPFGAYKVHDPDYNQHAANIHDYFFLKSMDKVRPGGLVMHITSTGTLDKPDSHIREELYKQGDLVAAIRFPGGAHKENAGTEVVTDMLILRKRLPGEQPGDNSWLEATTVPDPAGGDPIPVNKYFATNPQQILGTLDRTGTMYKAHNVNVSPPEDFQAALATAIDRLPANVMSSNRPPKQKHEPDVMPAPGDVKIGGFHVGEDGKIYLKEDKGTSREFAADPKVATKIKDYLGLRDAYRAVVAAEYKGSDAEAERANLNTVYDAFVAKHGPVNSQANRKAIGEDPDRHAVRALEKYDRKKDTAEKAAMFTKVTVGAAKRVDKAETVDEALGVSLHEHGAMDIDHIAQLLGKDKEEVGQELVKKGLAFEDPTDGWTHADRYLSGNVRQKLGAARAAAALDPKYQANVTALEAVQPADIPHYKIEVKPGVPWIPPSDIDTFAKNVLNSNSNAVTVAYDPSTGDWAVEAADTSYENKHVFNSEAYTKIYGIPGKMNFAIALEHALNGTYPKFYVSDGHGGKIFDKDNTEKGAEKINDLKEQFKSWVWNDDERAERLHRAYNDNFNNIRNIRFNGQHLTLPGMNPEFAANVHPHIKDFVWQVITTGKGLAAHEVGTGKTTCMLAGAMELRRLGLAKKPCILCKKANIEQITRDAMSTYPGAKILSTNDMFKPEQRKATIAKIITGDYDMVLMTHDHFEMLDALPETKAKFIKKELDELIGVMRNTETDDTPAGNRIVKDMEKKKLNLEAKLKGLLDSGRKDDAIYFEDLGIDHIFADEAHKYKSLPVHTSMGQIKGIPTSRSEIATDMQMKSGWLAERNGGRGLTFLTGTPVGNTMVELYTMQKFLQPEELEQRGIHTFDAWARTFGNVTTNTEKKVDGSYGPVTRFAEFTNVPELMQLSRNMMDVKRVEDLPLRLNPETGNMEPTIIRPKKNLSVHSAPVTPAMKSFMADLQRRAEAIKARRGPAQKGDDNMLNITTDGRKAAIDLRLVNPSAEDQPDSKTNKMISNVADIFHANPGKTQMIFSDVGVNDIGGFHLFGDIIQKLQAAGIPREKIVDFTKMTELQKQAAIQGLNDGTIAVALGGTETLGTGVNAQKQLMAIHHLDCPWRPDHLEQREGRGFRHGNKNKNLQIHNYVAKDTLDELLWQGISRKSRFISQVMHTDVDKLERNYKEEDTEELTPDQIMAAASGDPRILERVQLTEDVRKMTSSAQRHTYDQQEYARKLKKADAETKQMEGLRNEYQEADAAVQSNPDFKVTINPRYGTRMQEFKDRSTGFSKWLESIGAKKEEAPSLVSEHLGLLEDVANDELPKYGTRDYFGISGYLEKLVKAGVITQAGQTGKEAVYTLPHQTEKAMGIFREWNEVKHEHGPEAALKAQAKMAYNGGKLGTLHGLDIVKVGDGEHYWSFGLRLPGGYIQNAGTSLHSIEKTAKELGDAAKNMQGKIEQHHKDTEAIRQRSGKPFPKADELKNKQERLTALVEDLKKRPDPNAPEKPPEEDQEHVAEAPEGDNAKQPDLIGKAVRSFLETTLDDNFHMDQGELVRKANRKGITMEMMQKQIEGMLEEGVLESNYRGLKMRKKTLDEVSQDAQRNISGFIMSTLNKHGQPMNADDLLKVAKKTGISLQDLRPVFRKMLQDDRIERIGSNVAIKQEVS